MTAITQQPNIPAYKRGHINCFYRIYKGKKLGPYYVRRWKVGRKLYKEYIKPENLEHARQQALAYKERRKRQASKLHWINNRMANLNYMVKMCRWADEGKLRSEDIAYMNRIHEEGWDVEGRPPTRRKVVHELITTHGKDFIKKTVFELDGTTKVFMVPFSVNRFRNSLKSAAERFETAAMSIWNEFHKPEVTSCQT